MNGFMLPLFVLGLYQEGHLASIRQTDSKYDLINYENDVTEGMTQPLPKASDHYSRKKSLREPETPYVVEIRRKYIKFKTTGFPSQKIKLTQNETKGIQNLSLGFVELLNSSKLSSLGQETEAETETVDWMNLNPVITLSQSGISLQFINETESEDAGIEETGNRDIFWNFLTRYVSNIFESKVKELKVEEKYADVIGSITEGTENATGFENFVSGLWKIMRLSIDYAETVWKTTTTPPAVQEGSYRQTISTVFAYEEQSPFHVFPSQEFEHRRKDVDSIFYGRGII